MIYPHIRQNRKLLLTIAALVALITALMATVNLPANAASETALNTTRPASQPRILTDAELDELLGELSTKLGKLKSIWAVFDQTKHLAILEKPLLAEGVLLFASPDRIRFEYTRPFRSVSITVSNHVTRYDQFSGSWRLIKSPQPAMQKVVQQIASWMRGRFDRHKGLYIISAVHKAGETMLILTPRSKKFRQFIQRIKLTLSQDRMSISEVTIMENARDSTRIVFTQQLKDVSLPERAFETDPDGPADLPAMPIQTTTSNPAATSPPTSRPIAP